MSDALSLKDNLIQRPGNRIADELSERTGKGGFKTLLFFENPLPTAELA